MSGQLHACEEIDDFFSLYSVGHHSTEHLIYGFGWKRQGALQAQERNHEPPSTTITSSICLHLYHDHPNDDHEQVRGTCNKFYQKLTRRICIFLSITCTIDEAWRQLQVERMLAIKRNNDWLSHHLLL